jgi:site-specific DNA-adenine methylase
MSTTKQLKAPFPWFGGKSKVAKIVWNRFGIVRNYVEPFFGSGAVMLNRPMPFDGTETVNDADGLVSNFWRAVAKDPDAVSAGTSIHGCGQFRLKGLSNELPILRRKSRVYRDSA